MDHAPAHHDDPDALLVVRLKDGDAMAGDALVDRHTPALLGYLRRLVRGDASLAEDLHQATWTSALEHLDSFDPAGGGPGFKPWLFRIATNKAADHFRRRGRESRRLDKLSNEPMAQRNAEAPDAPAVLAEEGERLRAAVAELPEPQRVVVELRFWGGLKFVEIAEAVGCPLNTALGRMHKALKKLRAAAEEPPEPDKSKKSPMPDPDDTVVPGVAGSPGATGISRAITGRRRR